MGTRCRSFTAEGPSLFCDVRRRATNALESCPWCFSNKGRPKHLTISIGQTAYLMLPPKYARLLPSLCHIILSELHGCQLRGSALFHCDMNAPMCKARPKCLLNRLALAANSRPSFSALVCDKQASIKSHNPRPCSRGRCADQV